LGLQPAADGFGGLRTYFPSPTAMPTAEPTIDPIESEIATLVNLFGGEPELFRALMAGDCAALASRLTHVRARMRAGRFSYYGYLQGILWRQSNLAC
jgi:hypothetical protein